MSKEFPVLASWKRKREIESVPWSLLNERRAQVNHSQSLERLAERGGLSPSEALANIKDCGYYDLPNKDDVFCESELIEIVKNYRAKLEGKV